VKTRRDGVSHSYCYINIALVNAQSNEIINYLNFKVSKVFQNPTYILQAAGDTIINKSQQKSVVITVFNIQKKF
jgi:hypothetical protein